MNLHKQLVDERKAAMEVYRKVQDVDSVLVAKTRDKKVSEQILANQTDVDKVVLHIEKNEEQKRYVRMDHLNNNDFIYTTYFLLKVFGGVQEAERVHRFEKEMGSN